MTMSEKITVCRGALNYIMAVTEKQERVLDFETMYSAYVSVFGENTELTEYGFKVVYDSYLEAISILEKLYPFLKVKQHRSISGS